MDIHLIYHHAVISDDNTHDVDFIYKVIEFVTNDIKTILLNTEKLHHFTDGFAVSKKTENHFSICANFNMSSACKLSGISLLLHGKSPCDGIIGKIKRLTAAESLTRPYNNQI